MAQGLNGLAFAMQLLEVDHCCFHSMFDCSNRNTCFEHSDVQTALFSFDCRFGKELAKNVTSDIALKNINATVEGYKAIELVLKLAQKFEVEMPICEHVFQVTQGKISPKDAVTELLLRKPSDE